MSAPTPTVAMGAVFVKISASGPMPTSRYCDHAPCSTSVCLSAIASAEPGRIALRSPPTSVSMRARIASARDGSPRACSSMTRSRRLETKVTPLALTGCRSTGARNRGAVLPGRLAASRAPTLPRAGRSRAARIRSAGCSRFRRCAMVGASPERSRTVSPRSSTGLGPGVCPPVHARPTRSAADASRGRMCCGVKRSAGFIAQTASEGTGTAILEHFARPDGASEKW